MKPYLEAGKIVTTHGIHGDVKAECYCDSPTVLKGLETLYLRTADGGYRPIKVVRASVYKQMVLLRFEGCESVEAAALYRGKTLYAARADLPLPEGTFFLADLVGLSVYDAENGEVYGKVKEVTQGAASDLYEIETKDGRNILMPAVPAFVKAVDLVLGVAVTPIPGLFDDGTAKGGRGKDSDAI